MSCVYRWAQFRHSIPDIETNVKTRIEDKPVSYRHPIGGGYYVSVTAGFNCIDIRKFFLPYGQTDIKPTRRGLVLRLHIWMDMKKIIENVDSEYYELGTALPCYLRESHQNQIGALECSECNPFKSLFFWTGITVSLVYKKIHSDTRVSLLFLRSDEMDVCGIFTMEFEGLRLNMWRLQNEADDLIKELNASILPLLTIMWKNLLLNCTCCAIPWNTWQNVCVKCTTTVRKHVVYRKVTRSCCHDVSAKTQKTKSMLILVA